MPSPRPPPPSPTPASPRGRGRVGISAAHRRDEADHSELRRLLESGLLREVRVGIVLRSLDAVLVTGVLGVGVTHRAFFALGSRPRAALFLVGVRLGDLSRVALLLLALGRRVEQLLHHQDLIPIDVLAVVATHVGHEEREDGHEPHVEQERQPRVQERRRLGRREEPHRDPLARVHGADLEHERAALELHPGLGSRRKLELVGPAHLSRRTRAPRGDEVGETDLTLALDVDVPA
jgi:hypothetical protein